MGTCCASRDKSVNHELDLPPPPISGNAYQKFELSLPFACTWIDVFEKRVRSVEKDGGVTLDDLRNALTTPAWKELKDDDSKICKVLKHPVFETEEGSGIIDVNALLSFAMFHCAGSGTDKATVFYGIFQDGGVEKQPFISANDKDFPDGFDKHLKLTTLDLISMMIDIEGVEPMDLAEKAEDIEYSFETIREEVFLDTVFGSNSRLDANVWIPTVAAERIKGWVFDAQMCRCLVFDKTGIEN